MGRTFEKAVTGFNHNIKHKGRIFHVQTEDSGVKNPHVITHLFVGGNIIATKKVSYKDLVGSATDLGASVRDLMEAQHKDMLRSLIAGKFDDLQEVGTAYQPGEIVENKADADELVPATLAAPPAPVLTAAPRVLDTPSPLPLPLTSVVTKTPADPLKLPALDDVAQKVDVQLQPSGTDLSLDEVIMHYLAMRKP